MTHLDELCFYNNVLIFEHLIVIEKLQTLTFYKNII